MQPSISTLTFVFRDTIVILDKDSRVICVLVGRPQGLTPAEREEWDAGMADLARAFEEERTRHQRDFSNHGRGSFAAFATGFTMGPGCSVRMPAAYVAHVLTVLVEAHQRGLRTGEPPRHR